MRVADYSDLRVFRLAFDSAMEILEFSRRWPPEGELHEVPSEYLVNPTGLDNLSRS